MVFARPHDFTLNFVTSGEADLRLPGGSGTHVQKGKNTKGVKRKKRKEDEGEEEKEEEEEEERENTYHSEALEHLIRRHPHDVKPDHLLIRAGTDQLDLHGSKKAQ